MRRTFTMFAAAALAAGLAACTETPNPGTDGGTDGGTDAGFVQPAGTVAVNFTINDTANKVFKPNELQWKGSFKFDAGTRILEKDSTWTGPFPVLFDDGPWNAGGHEPANATAGDNKWGITVFVRPPATGSDTYEYGAIDATTQGWIWRGTNGTFSVAAGATAAITADGLTMPAFGTNDLKLVINKNALATRPTLADGGTAGWDTTKIAVKGSAWSWQEVELKDDGVAPDDAASDGNYTFILSGVVGAGKLLPHSGLLNTNDKPEFVFVLNGVEYKGTNSAALDTGVTAFTKASGGSFVAATIAVGTNNNTYVTIP